MKLTENELDVLSAVYYIKNFEEENRTEIETDIQETVETGNFIDLDKLRNRRTVGELGVIIETDIVGEIFNSLRNKGLVEDDDRISEKGYSYIEQLKKQEETASSISISKINFKKIAAAITGICGLLVAVIELIKLVTER